MKKEYYSWLFWTLFLNDKNNSITAAEICQLKKNVINHVMKIKYKTVVSKILFHLIYLDFYIAMFPDLYSRGDPG